MRPEKITIIRTAVGSMVAAGVIKEFQKRNIRVIGVDCNPLSVGFYLCDKSYVVPKAADRQFLKQFLRVCQKEKPQAIISGPEDESLILSQNRSLFEKMGILLLMPSAEAIMTCADKNKTHKFFQRMRIPAPRQYKKSQIKFPIILKPRFGRGGGNVHKINNRAELKIYIKQVQRPIFQEYIDGIEYTIDVLCDLDGALLSIIPRVRIKIESGKSTQGKTVYNKKIIEYCKTIAAGLKLIGPACIQCIKNKRGVKFIEINPRFGGGSILSIKADPTIIPNLIRIIKRQKPKPGKAYKRGLTMLRYYSEIFI